MVERFTITAAEMSRAIIAGTYADLKFVKTRSVAQIVVEIPIEQADAFMQMFGVPLPGRETPIAIARLSDDAATGSKPEPAPKQKSRAQMAGILCNDPVFRAFIRESQGLPRGSITTADEAAEEIRRLCEVTSRRYLDQRPASDLWDSIMRAFEAWKVRERVA